MSKHREKDKKKKDEEDKKRGDLVHAGIPLKRLKDRKQPDLPLPAK